MPKTRQRSDREAVIASNEHVSGRYSSTRAGRHGVVHHSSAMLALTALLSVPAAAIGGEATKCNDNDVWIPDGPGTYVHSPITITEAPAGRVVTSIVWAFQIVHADGRDLDVDLNDQTRTSQYKADLWRGKFVGGLDEGSNPNRAGATIGGPLIGLPVNQTWYLAAADVVAPDMGYIDAWCITINWTDPAIGRCCLADGTCRNNVTSTSCESQSGTNWLANQSCNSSPCPATCGDGLCNGSESPSSCCQDCGCPDDGNPCTSDLCSGGTCQHVNNTIACNDGNSCTTNDRCSNGVCSGTPISCNDGNPCTNDSCLNGVCQYINNSNLCNDNNSCTSNDRCSNGFCSGTPTSCGDGSCDLACGENASSCPPDCGDCADDDDCEPCKVCASGTCIALTCPPDEECHDELGCVPVGPTGACCIDAECIVDYTELECESGYGAWQGAGSNACIACSDSAMPPTIASVRPDVIYGWDVRQRLELRGANFEQDVRVSVRWSDLQSARDLDESQVVWRNDEELWIYIQTAESPADASDLWEVTAINPGGASSNTQVFSVRRPPQTSEPLSLGMPWTEGEYWFPQTYDNHMEHLQGTRFEAVDFYYSTEPGSCSEAANGSPSRAIRAAQSGFIWISPPDCTSCAAYDTPCYQVVQIVGFDRSGSPAKTQYIHLEPNSQFQSGDPISEGDEIGRNDSNGCASSPHLHFVVHKLVDGLWARCTLNTDEVRLVDETILNGPYCPSYPTDGAPAQGSVYRYAAMPRLEHGSGADSDADGDGVNDIYDMCPDTLSAQSVDEDGCSCSQSDDDADGIDACDDECPATPLDAAVDQYGCSHSQLEELAQVGQ